MESDIFGLMINYSSFVFFFWPKILEGIINIGDDIDVLFVYHCICIVIDNIEVVFEFVLIALLSSLFQGTHSFMLSIVFMLTLRCY